jgi:hypothetical protein
MEKLSAAYLIVAAAGIGLAIYVGEDRAEVHTAQGSNKQAKSIAEPTGYRFDLFKNR